MKKFLIILNLILLSQVSFAMNTNSDYGKSWIRKNTLNCVTKKISTNPLMPDYIYKYCHCMISKFAYKNTMEELESFDNSNISNIEKINNLEKLFGSNCKKELSK